MTTIVGMPKRVMPIWKSHARWSAAEARSALRDLDASGLSVAAFAKREGLVPERLYNWRRRLADAEVSTTDFVELGASSSRPVEIVFPSGVVLRVAETIEPAVLQRLVGALDRGC